MESRGIIRRIDELGRIVIPKEICKVRGIGPRTSFEIYDTEEGILFIPHQKVSNDIDYQRQQALILKVNELEEKIKMYEEEKSC